jgi:nickel-dependent lactate racemase
VPAVTLGGAGVRLTDDEVSRFVTERLAGVDVAGRSVLLLVPDATRSCPLPMLLRALHGALAGRVARLTVLVALGTHAAMSEEHLAEHLGYPVGALAATYPGLEVRNHAWWDPDALVSVGSISAERVAELSGGRLHKGVDVRVNRAVVEHDLTIVVGPVFPHEVVGFSGGNKYFFPGVAGAELIDVSHWLGALITSATMIGSPGITPVRALIDDAVSLLPTERLAFCLVPEAGTAAVQAISFGRPESAWADASRVSAETAVHYLSRPVRRVLSVIPEMYDEMWTAAKGFYKVEPIVADGGEVVIYAPHVHELSTTHPEIYEIGYHCRDYFVQQWDRFSAYPWGVLAHSTHLRGAGTFDPETGETSRVQVTLATGIPEDVVRSVGLGYLDPASVDLEDFQRDPDTLYVEKAGEILYRLR